MARDIDQIIELLRREIPGVQITQLQVTHPGADDDGLWFIKIPGRTEEVQIESSSGACPFLIESDFSSERHYGRSIYETVGTVMKLFAEQSVQRTLPPRRVLSPSEERPWFYSPLTSLDVSTRVVKYEV